ncbi:Rv3654c family TadE-like protein [Agromyces larvae]|uniref:Flp pilus-assembly TadE/G-like family protein n=1 Tax=Agromyces larvae TaxID=2929802 RepID=A0ABY4C2Z8_9MICO|nr:Rv3654c family TadE-like protein [Agromyces larvae]UOE44353.1 flp pilus-assembly TadE/G-like family protein [Agromyces larvae]
MRDRRRALTVCAGTAPSLRLRLRSRLRLRWRRGCRDERGAGTVLVLATVAGMIALTALIVPLLAVPIASQRAANAADAAALAAADALSGAIAGVPCDLAAAVAERNGAQLVGCETAGPVASVSVRRGVLGLAVEARARAGPPGWAD